MGHLLKVFDIVDLPADEVTGKIIESTDIAWKYRCITMAILFFVVMPFNLQKNLATLRYFSMFILFIVFMTIAVSVGQSPSYYKAFKDNPDYQVEYLYKPFDIRMLQGLATMMFSFNCQITFFYVRGELRSKTTSRVRKVLRNVIILETIFYSTIALSGYISLGDKLLPGVYTLRIPRRKKFNPNSFFNICFRP